MPDLTLAIFEPLLGKSFRFQVGEERTVELALIEAVRLPVRTGAAPAGRRQEPFSLVFRGPKGFLLPQRSYCVDQESLGTFDLFVVPINPDAEAYRYEALFN